jgi:hypothetical protein
MKLAAEIGETVVREPVPDLVITYQVKVSKAETEFMERWMQYLTRSGPETNEIPACVPSE